MSDAIAAPHSAAVLARDGGQEGLHLQVAQICWEADSVVSLTLCHPDGRTLPPWEPGAHLEVMLPSGLVRHYSMCGSPDQTDRYVIAVLRDDGGRGGSREIHKTGLVGQMLLVRGPRNHFPLGMAEEYLLIAGGIGITPILTMARRLDALGRRWRLIYGGRSRQSMAFQQALSELSGKVELMPQDEFGLLPLADILGAVSPGTAVYACGPAGLLDAVTTLCRTKAIDVHVERFSAAPLPQRSVGNETAFDVHLAQSSTTLVVPADRTILDVVRDVRPDAPASCEEGYCGGCETRVVAGLPEHRDCVLTEEERAVGETMMICVSRSFSDRLVLDL